MKKGYIAVDGASKGNPGPAGIGIVISDDKGKVIKEIGQYIGHATNNFAEYTALIRALSEAREMGFTALEIQTDSELMARQISGRYKVRNEAIIPLYDSVTSLLSNFRSATVTHVLREKNKAADKLASGAALSGAGPLQGALLIEEPSVEPEVRRAVQIPEKPAKVSAIRRFSVRTLSRSQFVDITREVQDAVTSSGITDGVCTVCVPHTTAGVTINENADPDVVLDILDTLNRLVPKSPDYRHREGNADSHVKASMMGFSVSVFVENGTLSLGTWQGIYFCEFDGPRSRQVCVNVG
jgi:secondary thiamine-phosphate synthase enzyme